MKKTKVSEPAEDTAYAFLEFDAIGMNQRETAHLKSEHCVQNLQWFLEKERRLVRSLVPVEIS